MLPIGGRALFLVLIFISHTASKTVKTPNVEPLMKEDQKLVSESNSEPLQKPDNVTSAAALQGTWEKFVVDKHEHQKARKHGNGKLHNTSIPVNHNNIDETSLQSNRSNNEANSNPDFQLTNDEAKELSLGLVGSEITKIEDSVAANTSTSNSTDDATELTVTSQSLLLKQLSDNNDNETAISSVPIAVLVPSNVTEATTTAPSLASADDDDDDEEEDDDEDEDDEEDDDDYNKSYKDKARPSFHPYFEEILNTENQTDGMASPSVVLKQAEYLPSQNALTSNSPFGQLPTFSEKELGRLRLNHWRVKQILKGAVDVQAEKLGLPGSRKEILQSKYPHPILGQKRAATTSSSAEATYLDDSAADSFSSLLTSADQDKSKKSSLSSSMSPTNLRTFFSWFTTPKFDENDEPYYDPKRAAEVKAQQAILPIALDYRGDFLFW